MPRVTKQVARPAGRVGDGPANRREPRAVRPGDGGRRRVLTARRARLPRPVAEVKPRTRAELETELVLVVVVADAEGAVVEGGEGETVVEPYDLVRHLLRPRLCPRGCWGRDARELLARERAALLLLLRGPLVGPVAARDAGQDLRIVPIDTTGFDGASSTTSAAANAGVTAGAGCAVSAPACLS